ncbi:hypothetical protein [Pandoraea sp. NPDC087047]
MVIVLIQKQTASDDDIGDPYELVPARAAAGGEYHIDAMRRKICGIG